MLISQLLHEQASIGQSTGATPTSSEGGMGQTRVLVLLGLTALLSIGIALRDIGRDVSGRS